MKLKKQYRIVLAKYSLMWPQCWYPCSTLFWILFPSRPPLTLPISLNQTCNDIYLWHILWKVLQVQCWNHPRSTHNKMWLSSTQCCKVNEQYHGNWATSRYNSELIRTYRTWISPLLSSRTGSSVLSFVVSNSSSSACAMYHNIRTQTLPSISFQIH